MNKVIINDGKNINYLGIQANDCECNCIQCGACVGCIIFAPVVGVFLSLALGINLYSETSVQCPMSTIK